MLRQSTIFSSQITVVPTWGHWADCRVTGVFGTILLTLFWSRCGHQDPRYETGTRVPAALLAVGQGPHVWERRVSPPSYVYCLEKQTWSTRPIKRTTQVFGIVAKACTVFTKLIKGPALFLSWDDAYISAVSARWTPPPFSDGMSGLACDRLSAFPLLYNSWRNLAWCQKYFSFFLLFLVKK